MRDERESHSECALTSCDAKALGPGAFVDVRGGFGEQVVVRVAAARDLPCPGATEELYQRLADLFADVSPPCRAMVCPQS